MVVVPDDIASAPALPFPPNHGWSLMPFMVVVASVEVAVTATVLVNNHAPVTVNACVRSSHAWLIFPFISAFTVHETLVEHSVPGVSVAYCEESASDAPVEPRFVDDASCLDVASCTKPFTETDAFGAPERATLLTYSTVANSLVVAMYEPLACAPGSSRRGGEVEEKVLMP